MSNKTRNKNVAISIVVVLAIICVIFGGYKYGKKKTYDDLIDVANKNMNDENYDKAIQVFNKCLEYKDDLSVKYSIKNAELLKKDKIFYDKGIEFMKNEDYIQALDNFDSIKDKKSKFYSISKEKIKECKKELLNIYNEEKNKNINSKYNGTKDTNKGISKETAEKLVKKCKIKDEKLCYLGIEKVPYSHIKTEYSKFPQELRNKKVYVFEARVLLTDKETVCSSQYYVDFSGNVYRDTYFQNLECVKVK